MAYALFANRKIYYTNLVFTLQQKLDNISQQKQSLLNFSANISDGVVTVDEIASDATNYNNYTNFLAGADAYASTADDEGGAATTTGAIGDLALAQNDSEEYIQAVAEMINQSVNTAYAKQYSKQLEAQENELDMQQKKIETQLTAAQQELQSIEQAEGNAISQATPKYSGVA